MAGTSPARTSSGAKGLPLTLRLEVRGQWHIVNVSSVGGFVAQPTGAVYSATRLAAPAISEGLRKEGKRRGACICPGVVTSELANMISDASARERMVAYRRTAIEQPADVDVNEIVVRPLATQV